MLQRRLWYTDNLRNAGAWLIHTLCFVICSALYNAAILLAVQSDNETHETRHTPAFLKVSVSIAVDIFRKAPKALLFVPVLFGKYLPVTLVAFQLVLVMITARTPSVDKPELTRR